MQNLDDVFNLLRDAESAIRRAGWAGDDYSRPHEIRCMAERYENDDFKKARALIKEHQRDQLIAQNAKEHRGTNEYGLDVGYIAGKLNLFLRDIDRYTRDEAARTLARLAITADESVLGEPELASPMPAQQSPRITKQDAREIVSILLADYREQYCGQSIDSWIESCEELLLSKLNNNPTT